MKFERELDLKFYPRDHPEKDLPLPVSIPAGKTFEAGDWIVCWRLIIFYQGKYFFEFGTYKMDTTYWKWSF